MGMQMIGTLHDSIGRPCTKPIAGVTQRLSTINRVPERMMSALPERTGS
jgi:hypothetical protein